MASLSGTRGFSLDNKTGFDADHKMIFFFVSPFHPIREQTLIPSIVVVNVPKIRYKLVLHIPRIQRPSSPIAPSVPRPEALVRPGISMYHPFNMPVPIAMGFG